MGYSLIKAIKICAAPNGVVFKLFWSENEHKLWPFWSEIRYAFYSGVTLGILLQKTNFSRTKAF